MFSSVHRLQPRRRQGGAAESAAVVLAHHPKSHSPAAGSPLTRSISEHLLRLLRLLARVLRHCHLAVAAAKLMTLDGRRRCLLLGSVSTHSLRGMKSL